MSYTIISNSLLKCFVKTIILFFLLMPFAYAKHYKNFIMGWVDRSDTEKPIVYVSGRVCSSKVKPEENKDTETWFDLQSGLGHTFTIKGDSYAGNRVFIMWLPRDGHDSSSNPYQIDANFESYCNNVLNEFSIGSVETDFEIINTYRLPLQSEFSRNYKSGFIKFAKKWMSPTTVLIAAGSNVDIYGSSSELKAVSGSVSIWDAVTGNQFTMLHLAVKHRDAEFIQALLEQCPQDKLPQLYRAKTSGNRTVLHLATKFASGGDIQCIEVLLNKCPNESVKELLQAKADGWTALHHAARYSEYSVIQRICLAYKNSGLDVMQGRWTPSSLLGPAGPACLSLMNPNPGSFSFFRDRKSGVLTGQELDSDFRVQVEEELVGLLSE